ncbi:unnamed protein product, partial [Brenthis ino]
MASMEYFENPFKDLSCSATCDILNNTRDSISKQFHDMVEQFKNEKLLFLTNNLKKDIFYDETIYTGSTGLALFYLINSFHGNEACHDTLQMALAYIDISNLKNRRISFICGDAGPLAIATVISYKLGTQRPANLPEYQHLARSQQYPSGNFPSSLGSKSSDRLVQWCHGAPGFVPLCVLANQVFKEEKYLTIAKRCGEVIWHRGLCSKGYSICHGVSGNAYAFLELYKATKKSIHLYRACCFMEWCMSARAGSELRRPDRPACLFEGLLGRIYLAADILHPLHAKFPAMCLQND